MKLSVLDSMLHDSAKDANNTNVQTSVTDLNNKARDMAYYQLGKLSLFLGMKYVWI